MDFKPFRISYINTAVFFVFVCLTHAAKDCEVLDVSDFTSLTIYSLPYILEWCSCEPYTAIYFPSFPLCILMCCSVSFRLFFFLFCLIGCDIIMSYVIVWKVFLVLYWECSTNCSTVEKTYLGFTFTVPEGEREILAADFIRKEINRTLGWNEIIAETRVRKPGHCSWNSRFNIVACWSFILQTWFT